MSRYSGGVFPNRMALGPAPVRLACNAQSGSLAVGERAAEEISQLIYHAQVLMIASGIGLEDVYAHLGVEVSQGHGAVRATAEATLPTSARWMAPCPCVARTARSTDSRAA